MFDFVHGNKRFVQIVLALIILTFAFWGVDSYNKSSPGETLATVNGNNINQVEFDQALRQQQDRMRKVMGSNYDQAMFDQPEIKRTILENLISQRLLMSEARSIGLTVSEKYLAQNIANIEVFQKDGKFDKQLYESVLRRENMSPLTFEANVASELYMRQLMDAYTRNGYASNNTADNLVRLIEQQRVVAVANISLEPYLKLAKVDEAAVKDYYDMNLKEFQTDEQVKVEYVTFSADALQSQVTVDEAEIKKYYDERQNEFGSPEERQAAHILIAVSAEASDEDKVAAKTRAEKVLQEVKQSPDKFAVLAKQYSQDPGSAASGGDLGYFGPGAMVKPFEEAVYKLKVGEISDLVPTDFGFHIIKLLSVNPANTLPLDEARIAITQRLKLQKTNNKFAELAEQFNNIVYEQSDTLEPAAELVKMPIEKSDWLSKNESGSLPWTDKAIQAVFSEDVTKKKRNSTAIEIAPNTLFAARLLEYKPVSTRPFKEVNESIRKKLQRKQALESAVKQGQLVLAQLQSGEKVNVDWTVPTAITREQHPGFDNRMARHAFQADVTTLPAYVGIENELSGYELIRVDEIKEVADIDEVHHARYMQQLRQITGEEMFQAYLADAKKNSDITMKPFSADENN
ncbi:SurA N-terminal domain-containing protein [Candidatus Nitrotoga sp. M5]|uniref:SurA N-terminal domain-containing protein n=1 Tax=Candidatus Nitrotoga sp. M5 TaxID=2890409 RepID=UPI001EF1F645|nr:SurA N-terminal domain-containing protein [Candidatus Nitrotoga sp. M5]CAH1385215.1 Peptidyl-prolyl cis-trans isomerase ppiD [Candidatus Nitrotoga sp. M5]